MKSSQSVGVNGATHSIGEIAGYFGLAPHVLRHWESVGLLTPAARIGGRRRYTPAHLARVAMILRSKEIGLSLAQIRDLLDACDGRGRRRILQSQLDSLDEQIERIQTSKQLIAHVLTCRYEDFTECPRFQEEIVAAGAGAAADHAEARRRPAGR
ncbi:MerR family transcriptional regulator [Nocardia carnea]|uniref:helix-turn-helix domain-containing protein n=1 Tax=Nocardia carnea TaxID=37328 RepID=UPI00245428D1|nr:MerR family transcriptional regulator [Nocardia carnea]